MSTSAAEAEEMRLVTTQGVRDAPLPATYEAARTALAQCESVDECSTWAKKAAALASYARQSEDKTLEQMAVRIRARAVRRCGELLREVPASRGGQPTHADHPTRGSAPPSRSDVAREAGLSRDQQKQAIRVAKIPERDFEEAIESEEPPTIEALAERGTQKKQTPLVDIEGRDPDEYNRALLFNGALRDLATAAKEIPPDVVFRGSVPRHHDRMRESAGFLLEWLNRLLVLLETHK